jgi:hypothetical protein
MTDTTKIDPKWSQIAWAIWGYHLGSENNIAEIAFALQNIDEILRNNNDVTIQVVGWKSPPDWKE